MLGDGEKKIQSDPKKKKSVDSNRKSWIRAAKCMHIAHSNFVTNRKFVRGCVCVCVVDSGSLTYMYVLYIWVKNSDPFVLLT